MFTSCVVIISLVKIQPLVLIKVAEECMNMKAKAHGLSLSAFFRFAADVYMNTHNW